ncbi:MAG: glycine--tRNA ligase subunit beta, partial [Deltaproteobacteria bacterium]|nr:glycine--tRNA ligase subunit beta [Deltaproteobacteria bacterium]
MIRDLVLEIGTEEIPARFIPGALDSLRRQAEEGLRRERLPFREARTLGTPRRLALLVSALEGLQEDREEIVVGPPRSAALDPEGRPTKVGLGFARSKGVAFEDLSLMETPKGVYLGLRKKTAGRPTPEVLTELLPALIQEISFPKYMRWGSCSLKFARPIHWILALYGDRVIPFNLEETAAGRRTYGHRFMAPQALEIDAAEDYLGRLKEGLVVIDPRERYDLLIREIKSLAAAAGGEVLLDPELLTEVANLVEYPVPVTGQFDSDFLALPPEVLITSMKEHQRYFPLTDAGGRLINRFIAVNNTRVQEVQRVVRGHEKVLRARLSDARFFFREDTKEPLAGKVERLKGVVFHSRLGTSFEKVERIVSLAGYLSRLLAPEKEKSVARCAWLAKADLTTQMVGEFPTLQGIMGAAYARLDGEDPEAAQGILEHYLPLSASDRLPQTQAGALVGLADRLDSLAGFFAIGQIPTGSADPYALRRQAQGAILVAWGKDYTFPLDRILTEALAPYKVRFPQLDTEQVGRSLLEFFTLRLGHLLTEAGLSREAVEAVLAAGWNDLGEVRLRARAIHEFQQQAD